MERSIKIVFSCKVLNVTAEEIKNRNKPMAIIRVGDGNSNMAVTNNFYSALTPFLDVSILEKLFFPVYIT